MTMMIAASKEPDFFIQSMSEPFRFLGQDVYITTTHLSILIVCTSLILFALIVRLRLKGSAGRPGMLQNIAEYIVEFIDNMVEDTMGGKGRSFRNYIGTLFLFLVVSNLSGLLGLRSPTADYGVTLPLALITFSLVQFNNVRHNKLGAVTDLFKPFPFLFPINLIGELALPLSMSLRLFGNVLSGTVIIGLVYALLAKIAYVWPAALHGYFDVFSGAIQAYVFCMLTMVFVADKIPDPQEKQLSKKQEKLVA